MDRATPSVPHVNGYTEPGVSLRMGPVKSVGVEGAAMNGKRKVRPSERNGVDSSSDDEAPLVRHPEQLSCTAELLT